MTSPHRLTRAQRRARVALVGLAVSSSFVVLAPADANSPNQVGVNASGGSAPYSSGAPSYEAPIPAGAGTGRKIGKSS
jgi:hypothetical protein